MDYQVHPELAGLHRDLSKLELEQLEQNIVEDGELLEPIVVWGQYLIDGRHRLPIARKHEIPHQIHEADFGSFEEAKLWVINHQLGRRNLGDQEMQRLRAELAKHAPTIEVAEASGVSQRTVQRDIEVENAISQMPSDIADSVRRGKIVAPRRSLKEFSDLDGDQKQAVAQKLRDNPGINLTQALPNKKSPLSVEEHSLVNQCPELTSRHKQQISAGTVFCTSGALREFLALTPEQRVIVDEMLNDPEIDSMDDAMLNWKRSRRPLPVDDYARIDKLRSKVIKNCEETLRLLGDIRAIKTDKSGYEKCISATKDLIATVESWR
jgi:hypothetical protein